jgi:hydrogenase maturation protein HypF
VQHHHAHALSLLAEHGAVGQTALVATVDGTGYGDDGTIWGGEVLALGANPLDYERVWHLPGFWLAGGDSAVRRPWKLAAGLLAAAGVDGRGLPSSVAGEAAEARLVASQMESHVGCVWTTSAGRVFDAVASLLGVCQTQTYEGQAGAELETVARHCPHRAHPWEPDEPDLAGLVAALADGYRARVAVACLAAGFHRCFAALVAAAMNDQAARLRPDIIGLSGGVAQNQLFAAELRARLSAVGGLCEHQVVPSNDGGLSLGQGLAGYLSCMRKESR